MTDAVFTPVAWSQLAACISRWTGFHPDAMWPRAVQSAVKPLLRAGLSVEDIVARAQRDDPEIRHRLVQAVPVGESFFFRVPEHFHFVAETLAPRWAADPGRVRRIWSAGCAAGEEAYSLAALLRAAGLASFEVVGTDLVEANVAAARSGRYGPWSVRGDARLMADPFLPASPGTDREVQPAVRAHTRFLVHNLLDAPPEPGRFDLIFCRNVLIYFAPDAARRACASLAASLAPGGVIAFATMDVAAEPPGLRRIGPPELQLFRLPEHEPSSSPVAPAIAPAADPAPAPCAAAAARGEHAPPAIVPGVTALEPVSLHLLALAHIERGEHDRARRLLLDLRGLAPDYLPGMLERALLLAREGRRGDALVLMRSVLERALALPSEQPIPGPETLPAAFYAAAARSFLGAEVRR